MARALNHQVGHVINGMTYLKATVAESKHPKGIFICHCGKEFECQVYNVFSGNTRSCGCYRSLKAKHDSTNHGMNRTHIWKTWVNMRRRCNTDGFNYYHDKGIRVCSEWDNSFTKFYACVSVLPNALTSGYSLDRIDSNGAYEPGNVRWATPHGQCANRNLSHLGSSGYTGIRMMKKSWGAFLTVNRNVNYLGSFHSKKEALEARNNYIIEHNLLEYPIQKWEG